MSQAVELLEQTADPLVDVAPIANYQGMPGCPVVDRPGSAVDVPTRRGNRLLDQFDELLPVVLGPSLCTAKAAAHHAAAHHAAGHHPAAEPATTTAAKPAPLGQQIRSLSRRFKRHGRLNHPGPLLLLGQPFLDRDAFLEPALNCQQATTDLRQQWVTLRLDQLGVGLDIAVEHDELFGGDAESAIGRFGPTGQGLVGLCEQFPAGFQRQQRLLDRFGRRQRLNRQ